LPEAGTHVPDDVRPVEDLPDSDWEYYFDETVAGTKLEDFVRTEIEPLLEQEHQEKMARKKKETEEWKAEQEKRKEEDRKQHMKTLRQLDQVM
jgi:hypothetical protein